MTLTLQEIQSQARNIREVLIPQVESAGSAALTRADFVNVLKFLAKLEKTAITSDVLRQTRIDRVLLGICVPGTRWPASLVERAERIMSAWDKKVSKLGELRAAALWGQGGRMEGCHKRVVIEEDLIGARKETRAEVIEDSLKRRKTWVVNATPGIKPDQYGDVNLKIGRQVPFNKSSHLRR